MSEEARAPEPSPVDDLFRRQYGPLVASLTRLYGTRHLGLIEDVASEAWLAALRTWPSAGVPRDPLAWLVAVARNRALDSLRRKRLDGPSLEELEPWARPLETPAPPPRHEIEDDSLRMLFTCCHPALAPEARVALTLKAWCGFGVAGIARALLVQESAIEQRLVRAKRQLEELEVPFEVPGPSEFQRRLDAVLDVVYLMFNEGYSAHAGPMLVRLDLIRESIRLGELLVSMPETSLPRVHALLALMLLAGARHPARRGASGDLLTLADQDRAQWDRAWIARGFAHFERSMAGLEISAFHLEAAIAAAHASAPRYEDTDWRTILERYDHLTRLNPSPVVLLARAVAIAKLHGIDAALEGIDALRVDAKLERYYLLHAIRAQFLWHRGEREGALAAFDRSIELGSSDVELAFLRARRERCARGATPDRF